MNRAVGLDDGRRTRHAGRRDELLDAVVAQVLAGGWGGQGLRELAAAAGVSHRTLLHHFSSREELLGRILERVRRHEQESLEAAAAVRPTDAQGCVALMDLWWSRISAPDHMPVVRLALEMHGATVAADLTSQAADSVDRWVELLSAVAEPWSGPDTDVAALVRFVYATIRGLQMDLASGGERGSVDAAYAVLRQSVTAALDSHPAGAPA